MTTSVKETANGNIEYSLLGKGKTILIVHGGHVDCRETIFQKGLDPNKFCFITPSRPGYGNTPLTELNKTPKGTGDLFVALLDELKIKKVIVAGISAGGLTALEIAANYPDRVDNLVLMSALTKEWFAPTDPIYKKAKIFFAPKIERFTWQLYKLFFKMFPNVMTKTMFKELSKYRPVEFTKEEFNELKSVTIKMRSYQGFYNDLDQHIDQEILKKIVCPTLILHSENDNKVSLSHPLNAKDKIKNSKLVTFNNRWGHMLWFGIEYEPNLNELEQHIKYY
jgi:pimeloyl-ACP methyl ester carboxylesterase